MTSQRRRSPSEPCALRLRGMRIPFPGVKHVCNQTPVLLPKDASGRALLMTPDVGRLA